MIYTKTCWIWRPPLKTQARSNPARRQRRQADLAESEASQPPYRHTTGPCRARLRRHAANGGKLVRCMGIVRATFALNLKTASCNLQRLGYLKERGVPAFRNAEPLSYWAPSRPTKLGAAAHRPISPISLYTNQPCPSRIDCNAVATSIIRCNPCQIVLTPGSPSRLRPRKPPSWAINRSTSLRRGGSVG